METATIKEQKEKAKVWARDWALAWNAGYQDALKERGGFWNGNFTEAYLAGVAAFSRNMTDWKQNA